MNAGKPILYLVEVDIPETEMNVFVKWYAGVHAPHLFQAGFNNCVSYRAVSGGLGVVDLYEADQGSVFDGQRYKEYLEIANADPYRPGFTASVIATGTRAVYDRHFLPVRRVDRDWVLIFRFGGDAALAEKVIAWIEGAGRSGLASIGAQTVEYLDGGRDSPTGRTRRPSAALLLGFDERPADSVLTSSFLPPELKEATSHEHFLGYRLYPWPNSTALQDKILRDLGS